MSASSGPEVKDATPQAKLWMLSPTRLGGHVFDPHDPDRRFVVELLIDGVPAGLARAEIHDPDLAAVGRGDGCYGFFFSVDPVTLLVARQIEIRLANRDVVLAPPLLLREVTLSAGEARRSGGVRWLGGLRFNGWLGPAVPQDTRIRAIVDGRIVAETVAAHWTHVGDGRDATPVRGFDLHLPAGLADGCVHYAKILGDDGQELPGSPCAFAAFEDGLARFVDGRAEIESQKLRGEFLERLWPQSLPFSMFAQWRERFSDPAPASERGPSPRIGVALIGEREVEASVASLEGQEGCDWVAAILEGGGGETVFHNASLREFLDGEAKDCEFVVFAPSGAVFQPTALAQLARALEHFPAAPLAYCDFTLVADDGGEWPAALSAFDYERMLEQGFSALVFVARAPFARAAAASGAENLFRLFNFSQDGRRARGPRHSDPLVSAAPVHLPGFLARLPRLDAAAAARALAQANEAHLAKRGVAAKAQPDFGALFASVHVKRPPPRGKASLLIPTRDRIDLLKPCLDSVFATADLARHEVIVLDNESSDPETLAYFEQVAQRGVRVIRIGGPFNFAKIVNKGASIATGQFLLLLNNDVEALASGWLDEMLGRMAEPDVGAVGATLVWPSGVVQHGGVVLGPSFDASHAFNDRIDGDPGYADLLRAAHEVSAVTAACLLTDRSLFLHVGGFDGMHFPVNYNDVDYCLKLRARGLRVVQTPHAKLLHRQSASRGLDLRADQHERLQREIRNLRAAWGDVLLADPYYSPLLSLDNIPFTGLAWPPRPARPRQNFSAPARTLPPGF